MTTFQIYRDPRIMDDKELGDRISRLRSDKDQIDPHSGRFWNRGPEYQLWRRALVEEYNRRFTPLLPLELERS